VWWSSTWHPERIAFLLEGGTSKGGNPKGHEPEDQSPQLGKPCSCINNMAKGSKKQQQPFSARFVNDFVEFTACDIQKTGKQPCCLPFGKADDTASLALPRVRRSLLEPHPWTPWIYSTLGFCNVRGDSALSFSLCVPEGLPKALSRRPGHARYSTEFFKRGLLEPFETPEVF